MKRIYIALVLLAIITAGCLGAILLEKQQLEELIDETYTMEQAFRQGDIRTASQIADNLKQEFPKKARSFALFLHHNVLLEIEECLVLLPLYLQSEEQDDFLAEISRCRLLLEKQLERELPLWENIF